MNERVLLVEDDDAQREMLTWALSRQQWEVTAARDAESAATKLIAADFDLVLTDVRLPGLTGLGLLAKIKQIAPETEVIVVTGFADLEVAMECVRQGAFELVQKPFEMNSLLATIGRAFERRKLRAEASLFRACQAIFATSEQERLPRTIVEVAKQVMRADDVSLMLPDGKDNLYVACSCGLDPELQRQVVVRLGDGIAGRAALERRPVLLNGRDENPKTMQQSRWDRVRSSIVYPLVTPERLYGVLNVSRFSEDRPFAPADMERVAVLASQILLALQNTALVRQLVEMERLAVVGELAAGVGHEINNPLAFITANIHFLQQQLDVLSELNQQILSGTSPDTLLAWVRERNVTNLAQQSRDALVACQNGTGRIRTIVGELLEMARPRLPRRLFDINDVVLSALRMVRPQLPAWVPVETELRPNLMVMGHLSRIRQVMVNILMNAGQAMEGDKQQAHALLISTQRINDRVAIDLRDLGAGIEESLLAHVFNPFFASHGGKGARLDLSLSQATIREHGGDISLRTIAGEGTIFTITLPAAVEGTIATG